MHNFINLKFEGVIVASLILCSDETCLSNNMLIHDCPLVMIFGNVACGNQQENTRHEFLPCCPHFKELITLSI
jgi:hypothetical protein